MKRWLIAVTLCLAGCASRTDHPQTYDNNDVELAVGNAARMTCSCIFVMKMPDAYCRAWVKASPSVAKYTVNLEAKTVESTALAEWGAKARFIDERRGCILE